LPAAIPAPDQRPPLTAATTQSGHHSQNDTAPTNRNNIATRSRRTDQQQHRRKITATLAATIPETSPAASLDNLNSLLDNAAEIG